VARIRTPAPIKVIGGDAHATAGPNPNPFFRTHDPGAPEIADRSKLAPPRPDAGSLIDITTTAGGRYQFRS